MLQKALNQLLFDVSWPQLDVLFLDLPPGTGDVQLTITQSIHLTGAVVISTPQDLALRDAVRGVEMFKKVEVPILGLVQNMSTFTCTNCGHHHEIFGLDGERPWLRWSYASLADFSQVQRENVKNSASICLVISPCILKSAQMLMQGDQRSYLRRIHHRPKHFLGLSVDWNVTFHDDASYAGLEDGISSSAGMCFDSHCPLFAL